LGSLCEEKSLFFNFFFWTSELHISQAFREHQARPIPTPYEPVANFCWKQVLSSFSFYFMRSSYMQPCGWNCPRAEGHGSQKIVCFAHKIFVFHFFSLFFGLMVLHDVTFNVTNTIWMWSFWLFSRNFIRSIVLKFGVKRPVNKNNSSSLILTNLELKFEACMLNLIWKWGAKDPKKREDHLIFINFGVKKFTLKKTPKKKNFDVWML
jgi:hypothetical protein